MRMFMTVLMWVLAALILVWMTGCVGDDGSPLATATGTIRIDSLTHPPGTLLRDSRGQLWMAREWPYRERVTPEELRRAQRTADEAIPMTPLEEQCSRDRRTPWQERDDFGPMELADGTLVRSDGTLYDFYGRAFHPFASEALAQSVGFRTDLALRMDADTLATFGPIGDSLTTAYFLTCPLVEENAHSDEDSDMDGATRADDCDDDDARRAPDLPEVCDGIDNDCDTLVDEDFHLGAACSFGNACQSNGVTVCSPDELSVMCEARDPECRRAANGG